VFGANKQSVMGKLNRRKFLKGLGVASGLAVVSGGVRASMWWDQAASQGFQILSAEEVLISDAIAEALFPGEPGVMHSIPGAVELGVTRFLDQLLVEMLDEVTGNAIRMLLHTIDEAALLSGGSVARFRVRSLAERVEILEAWDQSLLSVRRSVFSALKLFYAMGYCEHPALLSAMRIEYSCMGVEEASQA